MNRLALLPLLLLAACGHSQEAVECCECGLTYSTSGRAGIEPYAGTFDENVDTCAAIIEGGGYPYLSRTDWSEGGACAEVCAPFRESLERTWGETH